MAHRILIILLLMFNLANSQPLTTVAQVDLAKYAGKWYEIASFPQSFQKGCTCTTAEYTLSEKGFVIVENRCKRLGSGKLSYIKGKAFVVKNSGNAKLQVQFFWPFRAKYWIIALGPNYEYAVVAHPNRQYLWILSRTPSMQDSTYQQLCEGLKQKGFNLQLLQRTLQE